MSYTVCKSYKNIIMSEFVQFLAKIILFIFFIPLCFKTYFVEFILGPQSKSVLEIVFLDLRESSNTANMSKFAKKGRISTNATVL